MQFADTAAKSILTEDESLSSYQRKRLSQSFEKPPEAKQHKSHSPNFDQIKWDKEKVITDLKDYPKDKPINGRNLPGIMVCQDQMVGKL